MTNTYKWKWSSSPDDIYIIPRIFSFVSPFFKIISYFLLSSKDFQVIPCLVSCFLSIFPESNSDSHSPRQRIPVE